jgi:uncharacterized membrane protein
MALLIAAALALIASHAVLSAPVIRPALVGSLGKPGFHALHAGVSTLALAAFIAAYSAFDQNRLLFAPWTWSGRVAVIAMPLAFLLVLGRLLTPSGEPGAPKPPRGIYRITRHPGSFGLLLWAGLHVAATGDLKRVILFATMAAIALFAIVKNEWVLRRTTGPAAQTFRAGTSVFPFGALATVGDWARLAEIGWRIPAIALVAYAAALAAHPRVFGVDPLDWFR